MFDEIAIQCPYCGEEITIEADIDDNRVQSFVEDCRVCCKPIEVRMRRGYDGGLSIDVRTEDQV